MTSQTHILNGDALKQQFPASILGDIIVARECLVDGSVEGNNLEEIFATRASFISRSYGGTEQGYYDKTATEILKIPKIKNNTEINLWFEDDLFCQVNFWFVVNLLFKNNRAHHIFLIRPASHSRFGFGKLTRPELISIYENRIPLTEVKEISSLWEAYQMNHYEKQIAVSTELENKYPFIRAAVEAHIQRIPTTDNLGRPTESIIAIMKELKTKDFGTIFKEFCQREAIYGYGDLQIKRLYEDVMRQQLY